MSRQASPGVLQKCQSSTQAHCQVYAAAICAGAQFAGLYATRMQLFGAVEVQDQDCATKLVHFSAHRSAGQFLPQPASSWRGRAGAATTAIVASAELYPHWPVSRL